MINIQVSAHVANTLKERGWATMFISGESADYHALQQVLKEGYVTEINLAMGNYLVTTATIERTYYSSVFNLKIPNRKAAIAAAKEKRQTHGRKDR